MTTGPLFKWFGSKWNASAAYPPPVLDSIVEPFAGSACYSLRHHDRSVTIWEVNPDLSELWPWLISEAKQSDVLEIPVGLPPGTDIRSLGLSRGQSLLLKHWQRTGSGDHCWTIGNWGHLPGQWTERTRSRVSEEVSCVKHWRFSKPNWDDVSTWFIDPMYQLQRFSYRLPKHDYAELASLIKSIDVAAQVIVCEARCPKTGAAPDWLPFRDWKKTVTSRRKPANSHHSAEMIFTRDPYA